MARTRGMTLADGRELEPYLRQAWQRYGWKATAMLKQVMFIPAKLALMRKHWRDFYGQWIETDRTIKMRPPRREPVNEPGPVKASEPTFWTWLWDEDGDLIDSAPYSKLLSMRANERLIEERELRDAQP